MNHHPNRRVRGQGGFTLIELALVVIVIGVLAAIALPNYAHFTARAKRAQCISNQRNLMTAGTLFVTDFRLIDETFNCLELFNNQYAPAGLTECPESAEIDHNDFDLVVQDGRITSITCLLAGDAHRWQP